jgi:rod shape-determining protein MreD
MSSLLKNILRFTLFLLIQYFILNRVPPLHQFVKPYLYFLFIIWLPFSLPRSWILVLGFVFGLSYDYLSGTPGLHAACCVLISYFRPFLLSILLPQESTELSYAEPSIKSLGWVPYSIYVLILTFMHHALLVFIEWMQFGDILFFLGKVAATTALSLVLVALTEMVFPRKARYRTNAA